MLEYGSLIATYQYFVTKVSTDVEPRTYSEATKYAKWVESMKVEIQVLKDNKTRLIMFLPVEMEVIRCK